MRPSQTTAAPETPAATTRAAASSAAMAETVLTVTNLGVTLEGRTVLKGISFTLSRGTTLAVIGPNGAGKTVLLRSLLGLVPHSGTVAWAPNVKIGLVPQNFAVTDVPITVREFLALNRPGDHPESLAMCGLDPARVLDHQLGTLSGGELQRVLIAWALVDEPNVLVVDEPTAHIDIGAEDVILETLNRIEKERGMTILLVSHDIHNVMAYSDTALALNRTIIYSGPSRKLSEPELLIRIFGSGTILGEHRHGEGPA